MSQGSLLGTQRDASEAPFSHRMCELPSKRWERLWLWVSERINPIVVKEVRQSLKSKQFTVSFSLTLIAAVGWTLLAITLMVPRIYFMPAGLPLLTGFFCILTLPLMVIIPFSAFRSLAAETEDSTFELLSISALSATQIVYGKMASSCVQILLYLSALAPCIVLTYLLRGVSLFSIVFVLGLTVVFSLSETAVALLLAAVSRSRMVQTVISVIVLAGLLIGFFGWTSALVAMLGSGRDEFNNPPREIYLVIFGVLTILTIAVSLVLRTAAAAIDFPSENNSTPLRLRILGLLALILFWGVLGVVASQDATLAVVLTFGVFIAFLIIGGLVTGERGVISPRAQRTLPQTFFGRVFLTWLYPGAGLGYIFLVCLFAAWATTLIGVELYYGTALRNEFDHSALTICSYWLLCYLAFYLGVNRLLMLMLPRQLAGRMVGSVAMLAVLLLMAQLLPLFAVYYMNDYREFPYAWHQAFNIIWSLDEAMTQLSFDVGAGTVIITLSAVAVFGLNLILCTRDVMLVRVAEPPRVREEDHAAEPAPPEPVDPFAV